MQKEEKKIEKEEWNLKAKDFIKCQDVIESFENRVIALQGKSPEQAKSICNRELSYMAKAMFEYQKLGDCTAYSIFSVLLDIATTGLSIQPGSKSESYLEARSSKVGNDWINTARLVVTAYGELNMRIMSGQILRMKNPIVVYDCDVFQPRTNANGHLIVEYSPKIPRKDGAKIIGCYVEIVLPGGEYDYKWLLQDDIARLANYSKPKSGDNPQASALYSSNNGQIDPGFLEAKTIKHAMRAYTKLPVGDSVAFEGDDDTPINEAAPFEDQQSNTAPNAPNTPTPKAPETVVVNDDDEGVF